MPTDPGLRHGSIPVDFSVKVPSTSHDDAEFSFHNADHERETKNAEHEQSVFQAGHKSDDTTTHCSKSVEGKIIADSIETVRAADAPVTPNIRSEPELEKETTARIRSLLGGPHDDATEDITKNDTSTKRSYEHSDKFADGAYKDGWRKRAKIAVKREDSASQKLSEDAGNIGSKPGMEEGEKKRKDKEKKKKEKEESEATRR